MNDELLYRIALTRTPKVGDILAKNLVGHCGSAYDVFHSKKTELLKVPGIGETVADEIKRGIALKEAERELHYLDKNEIEAYFYSDKHYPKRLKHFDDAPAMLYFKGNCNLNQARVVSVVGTRKPTERGRAFVEQFVQDLLDFDVLIVSGLAFGIDVATHKACLSADIPTVGVLGHGLSTIYPHEHGSVAREMANHGGLLTEHPSSVGPKREHFPMRNRIIAGICDALVVVETDVRGGSMITAHMANEYQKDVFAVPGRLKDPMSRGCNHLIKTHRAALVESAADIAYIMRWDQARTPGTQGSLFHDLTDDEAGVLRILKSSESMSLDRLFVETGKSTSVLSAMLLELEFKGLVRALPGKRFSSNQ